MSDGTSNPNPFKATPMNAAVDPMYSLYALVLVLAVSVECLLLYKFFSIIFPIGTSIFNTDTRSPVIKTMGETLSRRKQYH